MILPGSMSLEGGTAAVEITPRDSQYLYGYPFVRRYSTGVHDPLWSSALCLSDGRVQTVIVANDVIWISKASVHRIRARISQLTGVPDSDIMITASHTHSGPITLDLLSNEADPAVPKMDARYVGFLEDAVLAAAVKATGQARPVEVGLSVASGIGVGTNRHDP